MDSAYTPITQQQVTAFLSSRVVNSHKGLYGQVAIVGGATGMVGAPLLAARAALKMGSGLVRVGLLAPQAPVVDVIQPELMLSSAAQLLAQPNLSVLGVGCGLGTDQLAVNLLSDVLQRPTPLVLDADALNLIAEQISLRGLLKSRIQSHTIITPHPGEAARLLGCSVETVQANRLAAARQLAEKLNCCVVLKGTNSICISNENQVFINPTGNPGMSSAGMGDVLTGMIASFWGQGLSVEQALLLGVYLHGAAGDVMAESGITLGMTASDVIDAARMLLNTWYDAVCRG